MFNLIKLNFYRLFHQKSFYVMIAVTAAIGFILIFSLYYAMNDPNDIEDGAAAESGVNVELRSTVDEDGYEYYRRVITSFDVMTYELYQSGFLLIIVSVFASVITWSESKNGFIKNIAGQMKQRGLLSLSKLPVILFQTAVVLAVTALSVSLWILIFYRDVNVHDAEDFIKNTAYQLFLIFAFGSFISMITTLCKNPAGGIITGILLSTGIPTLIYGLIDTLLRRYLGANDDFTVSAYTIDTNIMDLMISPETPDIIARGLTVGAVYLVISSVISYLLIQKRDVC